MGILGLIVQAFVSAMLDGRHDLAIGHTIEAQLVGDHVLWWQVLLL
ncbi:hypothetical protein Q669_27380 [Labrenzia sp. C1B10]|nr:hypothetical protein Q669_27380 [Labrenzia sp. C1B10]ERP98987.1 hypothetical protein Q675_14960 [Labrenzia sp. C1B70]